MWRLECSKGVDGLGRPLEHLKTLNNNRGRQVWVWDPEAGTPEQRAQIEEAREHYAKHRFEQQHAADKLYRCGPTGRPTRIARIASPTRSLIPPLPLAARAAITATRAAGGSGRAACPTAWRSRALRGFWRRSRVEFARRGGAGV